jgi:hypothetical protein
MVTEGRVEEEGQRPSVRRGRRHQRRQTLEERQLLLRRPSKRLFNLKLGRPPT